jgi:cytidylate kinase
MLITFAGLHGTGKTTVAKLVATELGLKHVSTGHIFRIMADESGMSLVEFSNYAAGHPEIDNELDRRVKEIGLEGDVVLDGQLCWYFLKDEADWKILLTCENETRINRILDREREIRGDAVTIDAIREETYGREGIEQERYKEIYGIDLLDQDFVQGCHDLVIDTTNLSIEQVLEEIMQAIAT